MTQEEKNLLLKDLCARLPYKVKVCLYKKETCILTGIDGHEVYLNVDSDSFRIESIKPYLRPMSSMTEEEDKEAKTNGCIIYHDTSPKNRGLMVIAPPKGIDWLNAHHFDYRGLIEKGLALEALEDMYKQ